MNMTNIVTAAVAAVALTAFSANPIEESSARASGKAKVVVGGGDAEIGSDGFTVVSGTVKVKDGKIVPEKEGKCFKQGKGCKKVCKKSAKDRKECNSGKVKKCGAAKKGIKCPKKCGKGNKAKPECGKKRGSGSWSYEIKDADGNPIHVSGFSKSIVSYTDPATGEIKTITSDNEVLDPEKIKELTGVDIGDILNMDIKVPQFDIEGDFGEFPRFQPPRMIMRRGVPPHRRSAFDKGRRGGRAVRGHHRQQQKIDELSAQVEELKNQIEQLKAAEQGDVPVQ